MADSASSQFSKITRIIRVCANICGCDVWNPNFRIGVMTYILMTCMALFFVSGGYTIYVDLILDNDWTVILRVFTIAGSMFQGVAKLTCILTNKTSMREMMLNFDLIYKEYESKGGEYTKYLHKRVNNCWKMMVAFILLYLIIGSSMAIHPIFQYVVHNEKVLMLQFLVPGINHKTDRGHEILATLHLICLFLAAFGHFGSDSFLFLNIGIFPVITDIFKVKLVEFNELVVQRNKYEQIREMFWELLAWHQKYCGTLCRMKEVYDFVFFVQLSTTSISILCCIFCIFLKVWPTAALFLIYSVVVLYSFCGLGTQIEISNEDFMDAIYSNLLWYQLPVAEQKLVILMVAKSQKEASLTAMSVLPLSMATALQLTKGIYSFSMMLFTYIE